MTVLSPAARPLDDAEVAAWRDRFPIVSRITYLVNNSLGAMPGSVPDSLAEFTQAWATRGVEAWPTEWIPEVRRVADLLGSLMGAPAGSVAVHQNVASLTSMVLSAVPLDATRNRVLLTRDEWPSHHYQLQANARLGFEVVVCDDLEDLVAALDERVALVICSHVRFRDSRILPLGDVARVARAVGAIVLGDGYHAVGHMPVDVVALGVDAYVGGSVKWLCGGPGVGWMYVRPDGPLRPADVGWLGHARPFGFEPTWEAAEGAHGWLGGTPGMPSLYSAREGYRAIAEVTPARVRATSEVLTAVLVEGATERGLRVRTPLEPTQRAGAVTIDLGERTAEIDRGLLAAGFNVDARPDAGIRVGAHFFNTAEECEHLLATLSRLL